LYGLDTWTDIYTPRQLLALATLVKWTRAVRDEMHNLNYPEEWTEIITGYLAMVIDRLADFSSTLVSWILGVEAIGHTFVRFALPMAWDFSEGAITTDGRGGYALCLSKILDSLETLEQVPRLETPSPTILQQTAVDTFGMGNIDLIITDPPYYNAIPYADLSDFFYVWLRRTIGDLYPEVFANPLTPKSDELALRLPHVDIPDEHTPEWYEQGMALAFRRAWEALDADGRMVIVFAHKDPDAWETLVAAMIQAGFTVTSSWPLDTEQGARMRAQGSAALSSSIWLVCRKRQENVGTGRYSTVRRAMQERVTERLRYFWDLGISGPDFVWAAVGPALESYSSYQSVRRLDGSEFTVSDFLKEVRRMVADFALGQILKGHSTEGLDEWTRYYLIHRSNFGLEEAPVGECILLSQGYGLDLNELRGPRGFTIKAGSSGIRLTRWEERRRDDLGQAHPSGGLPQIDMLHRLMHLWAAGNLDDLNAYANQHGLRQNELFWAVAQAILEMAEPKSRERTLLEAIVAWGRGKPVEPGPVQTSFINHE
jgi:putative DNA methylase